MTDFRRADEVLDEGEIDDEARTLIVMNPLARDASDAQAAETQAAAVTAEAGEAAEVDAEASEISDVSSWNLEDVSVLAEESAANLQERDSAEALRDSEIDRLLARDSAELLRDSEVDGLLLDDGELSASQETPSLELSPLPPGLLSESARARAEPTERITLPQTHPLANSIAPTSAPKSVAPASNERSPFWQMVAAAAILVGLGAAGSQLSGRSERASEAAATQVTASALSLAAAGESQRDEALLAAREEQEPTLLEPVELAAAQQDVEAEAVPVVAPAALGSSAGKGGSSRESARSAAEATPARASGSARSVKRTTAPADLPAQLSREQVVQTMRAGQATLSKCTGGRSGVVQAQLTVRNTGKVSYALIQGTFAGTPEGTCLVGALREIRFPEFAESSLRLTYPLSF